MPYPTQHENFYKNQVIQLQQELEHLTKQLDEGLGDIIRRVITHGGKAGVREAEEAAARAARDAAAYAAREAARLAAMAARVTEFAMMTPQEIINFINSLPQNSELRGYILDNWGTVVEVGATTWQSGRTWQRLLPDGTVQRWVPNQSWGTNGTWSNIDKPGTLTAFGYVGANGVVIPMDVYRGMGHGGISPGDITYSPYRPTGTPGTTPQKPIIPYQGPNPNVVPPM